MPAFKMIILLQHGFEFLFFYPVSCFNHFFVKAFREIVVFGLQAFPYIKPANLGRYFSSSFIQRGFVLLLPGGHFDNLSQTLPGIHISVKSA